MQERIQRHFGRAPQLEFWGLVKQPQIVDLLTKSIKSSMIYFYWVIILLGHIVINCIRPLYPHSFRAHLSIMNTSFLFPVILLTDTPE